MPPKAHLTSHSRMFGSRWVIIPLWLSGWWRSLYSSVYSCHLFLMSSAFVRSTVFHVAQWVKNPPADAARDTGDVGSIPDSGRSPWRRKWQFTPVLVPGESCGQRSLAGSTVHGVEKNQTQLKWLSMQAQLVNQMQGKERYSQANMKSMCYSQVFTDRSNKGHNPGRRK